MKKNLNPYGQSKVNTENFLIKNKDRFNSIILRYFNVAGADPHLRSGLISDEPTHLIKILSEVAVGKREKILIYGNDYKTMAGISKKAEKTKEVTDDAEKNNENKNN